MAAYIENSIQCVGSIDGSHIAIIVPQHYQTDYFNSKDWHSLILQAVVPNSSAVVSSVQHLTLDVL